MSFPKYPEYKESGIEILTAIPIHWQVIFMKRFAQLAYGDALPTDMRDDDGQIPVYGSNGIVGVHSTSNTKSPVILVGRKGSYGALNWSNQPVFAIDTVYFIDENYCSANLRWLFWTLHIADFSGCSQDTGVPGLSRSLAHNTCLPFPSSHEQLAIATFLDRETAKIDALVAEQEKLIELLKEKRQAVISHAVTKGLDPNVPMKDSGVEWLGEVPEHWAVGAIKNFYEFLDGKRIPLSGEERSSRSGEYPYYGASGVIDWIDDFIFDEDLVLVSEDGANLFCRSTPIAFVARGKYWVNNHAHILRPPDNALIYWAERIETIDLTPVLSGSAQPKLTSEALANIRIAIPPTYEERLDIQMFISQEAEGIDALVSQAQRAIDLLKERRSALISAAVTGKIDVRGLTDATQ